MMFLNDGFMRLFWNDGESVGGVQGYDDDEKMGKAYPNYYYDTVNLIPHYST